MSSLPVLNALSLVWRQRRFLMEETEPECVVTSGFKRPYLGVSAASSHASPKVLHGIVTSALNAHTPVWRRHPHVQPIVLHGIVTSGRRTPPLVRFLCRLQSCMEEYQPGPYTAHTNHHQCCPAALEAVTETKNGSHFSSGV